MIGDGEAETGPLAASWHGNKFLDPRHDGAVLPILHLDGYKIANPTVLARIPETELDELLRGYGHDPIHVTGDDPATVHRAMAAAMDTAIDRIHAAQRQARTGDGEQQRVHWPTIVLRTPRAGQAPRWSTACRSKAPGARTRSRFRPSGRTPSTSRNWRHGCAPTAPRSSSTPRAATERALACVPEGERNRLGANPRTNGGLLLRTLLFCCWSNATRSRSTSPEATDHEPTADLGSCWKRSWPTPRSAVTSAWSAPR